MLKSYFLRGEADPPLRTLPPPPPHMKISGYPTAYPGLKMNLYPPESTRIQILRTNLYRDVISSVFNQKSIFLMNIFDGMVKNW